MFGKGSVTSNEMNAHKSMAGADQKGSFGVRPFPAASGKSQPGVSSFAAMNDGERGAGPGLARKGGHAMQAAPDHGDAGRDSYRREGKA
jgi:hypothetical protein